MAIFNIQCLTINTIQGQCSQQGHCKNAMHFSSSIDNNGEINYHKTILKFEAFTFLGFLTLKKKKSKQLQIKYQKLAIQYENHSLCGFVIICRLNYKPKRKSIRR